jgi:uncharacterized membrane protein (UPF0127 family)
MQIYAEDKVMLGKLTSGIAAAAFMLQAAAAQHLEPGKGFPGLLAPDPASCEVIAGGSGADHPPPQVLADEMLQILSGGQVYDFTVENADQPAEQHMGLMYREDMPDGHGMLFTDLKPGKDGRIGVWMQNTYIPLDVVFIDAQGRIVDIHENMQPCDETVVWSDDPAVAMLELNAGTVAKLGLKEGDVVKHEAFGNMAAGNVTVDNPAAPTYNRGAPAP